MSRNGIDLVKIHEWRHNEVRSDLQCASRICEYQSPYLDALSWLGSLINRFMFKSNMRTIFGLDTLQRIPHLEYEAFILSLITQIVPLKARAVYQVTGLPNVTFLDVISGQKVAVFYRSSIAQCQRFVSHWPTTSRSPDVHSADPAS